MKYLICYLFGYLEICRLITREIGRWLFGFICYDTMFNNIKWLHDVCCIFKDIMKRHKHVPENVILWWFGLIHNSIYDTRWLKY